MHHFSSTTFSAVCLLPALCILGAFASSCLDPGPVQLVDNYTPRGRITELDGIQLYQVGPRTPWILIGIHDIHGFNGTIPNIRQIADRLGDLGYQVVLPDFFNGTTWDGGIPSPTLNPAYAEWLEKMSWVNNTRAKLLKIMNHFKKHGHTEIGLFGFSYGGRMVTQASMELSSEIKLGGGFTPAPTFITDSDLIQVPTFIVGSWEPSIIDYAEYCKRIEARLGNGTCEYHLLLGEQPGFMGSEADWTNSTVREDAKIELENFERFLCSYTHS